MLQNKAPSKAKCKPVLNQGLCTANSCLILFSLLKKDEKQGGGKGTYRMERSHPHLRRRKIRKLNRNIYSGIVMQFRGQIATAVSTPMLGDLG